MGCIDFTDPSKSLQSDGSLDEVLRLWPVEGETVELQVRELVGYCTCPVQFPIIKVGEGKYKIGDNQTLVFVRILRKHVMIRVGGGWDTLEHYLDRHDPCRCGFQGHRGVGRGPSTPRRASTAGISKSVPNTPKTTRKLSLTGPVTSVHSGGTPRPASPGFRSASPGPNTRKSNLTLKGGNSQPSSNVTSPGALNKKPNFPSKPENAKAQNVLNSSGSFPMGSFVKQSQANINRQLSSSSTSSQPPTTPRRCASPAPRPESPFQRRSESPASDLIGRLRSPSPALSAEKGSNPARTQSVPATKRCASPMKQITLSELRSSREGKLANQTLSQTLPRSFRRQTSTESNRSRTSESEMMSDTGNSNFAIDRISTMSLGEFKSLLNSALAVPNGKTDSVGSSDSPRSQGSADGGAVAGKPKSTPAKSAYSYRSVSASKTSTYKSNVTASKTGSNLKVTESRTTGGVTNTDKSVRTSYASSTVSKTTPVTNSKADHIASATTGAYSRSTSARPNLKSVQSSGYGQARPTTPSSMSRSSSKASSVGDNSHTVQSGQRTTFASRSSSHSSIHSCESTDDGRYSLGPDTALDTGDQGNTALTPSSVDSDYSFRGSSGANSDYTRSNSYTPCSAAEERAKEEKRANSEPKENISSISRDIQRAYGIPEEKPKNVGYATFSYEDNNNMGSNEIDEIENEIFNARNAKDVDTESNVSKTSTEASRQSNTRPQTPSGRQTPSLIPRPVTPKVSRKLSLPQNSDLDQVSTANDRRSSSARPPTPKKSTIIARAHNTSAHTGVRSADKSKEQTYREMFQKRSTTPGPGTAPSGGPASTAKRSMTPGPYLHKTPTLQATSATTNRARLNEALEQHNINSKSDNQNISNTKKTEIIDRKALAKQKSADQSETVIMVNVNRSEGRHSLSVQGENEPRQSANKPKVLARARTEDGRARAPIKTVPSTPRQRPQSVEPRQLMPRKNSNTGTEIVLSVKRDENGQHAVSDRTQEWVQTAVEQTQVQKTKVKTMRRAMTPDSFLEKNEQENEEPRTLEEIRAALTLPVEGVPVINPEQLEAPPEDAEMFATMEKLFHDLRQQELKKSVNETPGSSVDGSKSRKSKSSKSNSMNNDEEASVDSNKIIRTKTYSTSTRSSSNVTSPSMQRSSRSSTKHTSKQVTTSSSTNSGASNSITSVKPRTDTGLSGSQRAARPSSPGPGARRPPSPRTTAQLPPRPQSPRVSSTSNQVVSPKVNSAPTRPASPQLNSQPARPASPRVGPQNARPASPSPRVNSASSSRGSSPSRTQPPRPASTPPRPSTPVIKQGSVTSDDSDNVFETNKKSDSGNIIKKIKEIIKVNPRKDKAEPSKGKSRIPAPKSLAQVGKSRSFTNLSNLRSLSLSSEDSSGISVDEPDMNGFGEHINGGLNVTLSGRSETPKLKLNTPLTTGRSSLIRKESMEKNKNVHKLTRAVTVEGNLTGIHNNFPYHDDGEYV